MITRFFWILLLAPIIKFAQPAPAQSSDSHAASQLEVIALGQSVELPVLRNETISVSNGSILHLTDLGQAVRVSARKLGSATVRIGSRVHSVSVLSMSQALLYQRFQHLLKSSRGLELGIEGKEIQIRGRLLRFSDWQMLAQLAEGSEARYVFAAKLSPELKSQAMNHIRLVLREGHLPELALGFEPIANVSLPTEPSDLRGHVEQTLAAYGFRVMSNSEALGLEPMIRVKLLVAEFKKSRMRQIGVKWPSTISAQLLPRFTFPTESQLSVDINALEESGMGKVLASPTLLCRSGKEASFLAGGELPIKILNYKVQDIIWKQYGVRLNIKPRADFSGRMSIAIASEVSMLDSANTVDGIPGLLTNRIETHFDLTQSRTIVLSGLIKKEWGESSSGLPGLASLPILGPLFGSRDYLDHQTELVVFVTPEVAKEELNL